jgi:hypothetical protein
MWPYHQRGQAPGGAETGNIERKAPPGAIMAGPGNRAVGSVGGGATKTLHIAGRDWDHDRSEKGARGPGMRGLPIESPTIQAKQAVCVGTHVGHLHVA